MYAIISAGSVSIILKKLKIMVNGTMKEIGGTRRLAKIAPNINLLPRNWNRENPYFVMSAVSGGQVRTGETNMGRVLLFGPYHPQHGMDGPNASPTEQ